MQISALQMNYQNRSLYNMNNRQYIPNPTFKGGLSNLEADAVILMLGKKNTEVVENFGMDTLNKIIKELISKYSHKKVNSVGIMVVNNHDLPKLLGKDISKYNTNGKIGLCIAAGDTNGPVERMKNVYEAKTILTTMESLKL